MDVPDVRYARAGGVAIAYQVVGEGQQTLVFSPQVSDLHVHLAERPLARSSSVCADTRVRRLLNPRGTGLSDRPRNVTLEARMDDITSVLDHAACRGVARGHLDERERVRAVRRELPGTGRTLVLAHPFPRRSAPRTTRGGSTRKGWLAWLRENRDRGEIGTSWKRSRATSLPTSRDDPEELDCFVWQGRLALSPTAAADWARLGMETDIVGILGSIRVPTLVLHRAGETANPTQA